VIRIAANDFDPDMRLYISTGDGPSLRWQPGIGSITYDVEHKQYEIRVNNLCESYLNCDKPLDSIIVYTPELQRRAKMKIILGKSGLKTIKESPTSCASMCFGCADFVNFSDTGLAPNGFIYYFNKSLSGYAYQRNYSYLYHKLTLEDYTPTITYTDSVVILKLPGKLSHRVKMYFPDIDSTINVKHYKRRAKQFTFKKPVHRYVIVSKKSKLENYEMADGLIQGKYNEKKKLTVVRLKKSKATVTASPGRR
jgi:hypothetical protein